MGLRLEVAEIEIIREGQIDREVLNVKTIWNDEDGKTEISATNKETGEKVMMICTRRFI